jgi:DNA-directed RNA polymerase II subunit RPB2
LGEYGDEEDLGMEEEEEIITQEDCWSVISAFFRERGLVSQQLDSFNEFVQNTMQEVVEENGTLVVETNTQHTGADDDVPVCIMSANYT